MECKGIVGNDSRHYILDLLRTFPPDVNFLSLDGKDGNDVVTLSKEAQALGFPIVHAHKLSCLRQELIDAFVESRYMMFIKYAAVQLQQLGLKKQMDLFSGGKGGQQPDEQGSEGTRLELENQQEDPDKQGGLKKDGEEDSNRGGATKMEDDEAKKIVESLTDSITAASGAGAAGGTGAGETKKEIEESTKDIVRKASKAVGSLKETEFDIRFNPDVFSPGVRHAASAGSAAATIATAADDDEHRRQCGLIRDAADFLLTVQIPAFIRDCLDHSSVPMDGQTLADNLHNRGINIRYIGVIANMIAKVPQLSYVNSIVVSEVLLRSAKRLFAGFLQGLDLTCVSGAIAHFLNCLFCAGTGSASPTGLAAQAHLGAQASGADVFFRAGGGKRQRHRQKHLSQQVRRLINTVCDVDGCF